jgi:hypothetical protein
MFNLLKVIDCGIGAADGAVETLHARLREGSLSLPGVRSVAVGETLPRDLNGGHIMWRAVFDTEADCWNCTLSPEWRSVMQPLLEPASGAVVDTIAYATGHRDTSSGRQQPGIWRCLVMAVEFHAPASSVRQYEKDLLLMPGFVKAIRNWALSPVTYAFGRRRWTHIWEQEFDDVAGLEGEYMLHPIHWGVVDGWFDPECPQRIVDPWLIHASIPITEAVIR